MGFQKQKTKIITYRKYKAFDNERFRSDVLKYNFDKNNFVSYKDTLFKIFNQHAPLKKKYIRVNVAPFMSRHLHTEIIKSSRLCIFFF